MKFYVSIQIPKHWSSKCVKSCQNLCSVKNILSKKSLLRFQVGKKRVKVPKWQKILVGD